VALAIAFPAVVMFLPALMRRIVIPPRALPLAPLPESP
jgi:hypothetical protein